VQITFKIRKYLIVRVAAWGYNFPINDTIVSVKTENRVVKEFCKKASGYGQDNGLSRNERDDVVRFQF
jgi:hypothetical protein